MEKVKLIDFNVPVPKIVSGGRNWCNRIIYFCLLIIGIYFLWMDIGLYYHIQARKVEDSILKKTDHHDKVYNDITVKSVMMDPANYYIYVPTAEMFDKVTHFSTKFPFITANMISICHTFISLISAKMVNLDSLSLRRIGVVLFEFRTWVDALDGVVHRSHTQQKRNVPTRFSYGYYFDGVADMIGFAALCFGILFYLKRNLPKRNIALFPWRLQMSTTQESGVQADLPTKKSVLLKCASFGILMLLSAGIWDSFIESYYTVLESVNTTPQQQARELAIMQSTATWMILWSWRLLNAHSYLEMVLVAIFVDKIWEFLSCVQYLGYILLTVLTVATQIHLQYIQSMMAEFKPMTMA